MLKDSPTKKKKGDGEVQRTGTKVHRRKNESWRSLGTSGAGIDASATKRRRNGKHGDQGQKGALGRGSHLEADDFSNLLREPSRKSVIKRQGF